MAYLKMLLVCTCESISLLYLLTFPGLTFLAFACSAVFVGCQVMFEIRQGEMRKGIYLKC